MIWFHIRTNLELHSVGNKSSNQILAFELFDIFKRRNMCATLDLPRAIDLTGYEQFKIPLTLMLPVIMYNRHRLFESLVSSCKPVQDLKKLSIYENSVSEDVYVNWMDYDSAGVFVDGDFQRVWNGYASDLILKDVNSRVLDARWEVSNHQSCSWITCRLRSGELMNTE
jgi:hypothetical protein